MPLRDLSMIIATWVGVIAAIAGGYATYLQYSKSVEQQVDERSLAAMRFVRDFQGEGFFPIRNKIYNYILCSNCDSASPSESEIFAFVEFFDVVKYCADRQLCDATVVRDVFGPYATWHWPCLKRTIELTRKGEEKMQVARPYGHGLQTLVLADVGAAHCRNLARR
ncbi:MAG: hypothetical protein R3D67_05630 [Hyphomicrobiaceae bacterium]